MKIALFAIWFFICSISCTGQSLSGLLDSIGKYQCHADSGFYSSGMFPSQRYSFFDRKGKEDNAVFFSALIAYTLSANKPAKDSSLSLQIDSIAAAVAQNFPKYSNRKGGISYNFWQTKPDMPFPNSKWLSGMQKMRLPDDADDTSILFLVSNESDSLNLKLKSKLVEHSNLYKSRIKSTYPAYQNYQAYTTWFGEKMKPDFDICVQANTLLFVFSKNQVLNKQDSATIDLIQKMVLNKHHLSKPHIISPHYQNSAVIIYHLARLISVAGTNTFDFTFREQLKADAYTLFANSKNSLEKTILLSALYRLQEHPNLEIDYSHLQEDFKKFSFFVANPFCGYDIQVRKLIGKSRFFIFRYRCDAYNWALLYEMQVLKEKAMIQ